MTEEFDEGWSSFFDLYRKWPEAVFVVTHERSGHAPVIERVFSSRASVVEFLRMQFDAFKKGTEDLRFVQTKPLEISSHIRGVYSTRWCLVCDQLSEDTP